MADDLNAATHFLCHCAPLPCHGDVLARAAGWAAARLGRLADLSPKSTPHLIGESVTEETDMRQSRFTAEQIIANLAEQERGMRTAEVCRNHGISPNTFYKWKAKYGGLDIFGRAQAQEPGD